MDQCYIYVVLSATPYKIGKFIRKFTGSEYNHASIALDEGLTDMYSFARRHCRVPLYGGFVKESSSRFCPKGVNSMVKFHRIPVSQEAYNALEGRIQSMYQDKEHYLYNYFSFLSVPLHRSIPVQDAYTCVEFCVDVLDTVGFPVSSGRYYSIDDLISVLDPYTVYTGPMPQRSQFDADFYASRPLPHPLLTSVISILSLVPRMTAKEKTSVN